MYIFTQAVRGLTNHLQSLIVNQERYFLNIYSTAFLQRHYLARRIPVVCMHVSHYDRSPTREIEANWHHITTSEFANSSEDSKVAVQPESGEPDILYHTIEIEIRSAETAVLNSYHEFITIAAGHLGLQFGLREKARKPHLKRWTILKSAFVHRKHLVQYEVRTYHHKLTLLRLTGSTADTFLEYIQRNLPEGVAMRVGRERMEKIPEHLLTPPPTEDLEPTFLDGDSNICAKDDKN